MLSTIKRTKTVPPRRILLHGESGIGKSTWGAAAPKPIFFDLEGGLGDLDVESFPRPANLQEFVDQVQSLINEPHDYQTAVIDTADWLEQLIEQRVCEQFDVESLTKLDYGRGPIAVGEKWATVLAWLSDLGTVKGMQVILLAHSKTEKVKQPDIDVEYERISPRMSKRGADLICDWATEIFAARLDFRVTTKKGAFGKELPKVSDLKERVIYTTPAPTHVAKQRIALPSKLPLSYPVFAEHLAQARAGIAPPPEPVEDQAQPEPPATPVLTEGEFPHPVTTATTTTND